MLKNEEDSVKYCQYIVDQLSKDLMENISAGTFSVPGGHKDYRKAKEKLEWHYWDVPRKGVKVRNKGVWRSCRLKSRGSPESLRAEHHGDIMTVSF